MDKTSYVIGIDYGTDSVRSIIVDTANGNEIANAVHYNERWDTGKYCDPVNNQLRQHPLDYIEGLEITIKKAMGNGFEKEYIPNKENVKIYDNLFKKYSKLANLIENEF